MVIRKSSSIFSVLTLAALVSVVPARQTQAINVMGFNVSGKVLAGLGAAAALGVKYYFNRQARNARAEQIRRLDANNAINIIRCIEDNEGQFIDIAQGWTGSITEDGKKVLNAMLFKMSDEAANQGNLIKCLCNAGAEVDVQDDQSHTPLMRAVLAGHTEIVRALTQQGADPLRKNGAAGQSSIDLAAHNADIRAILLDAIRSQGFWEKVTWGAAGLCTGAVVGAVAGVHWMWGHVNRKYDLTVRKDWLPGFF